MPTISRKGDKWRAQVRLVGHRPVSRTFETQRAARAWGITTESELLARKRGEIIPRSVRAALVRYAAEVAPKHKGERWEQIRLKKFERTLPFIDRQLSTVRAADIAAWRDKSLLPDYPRLVAEHAADFLCVNPFNHFPSPISGQRL